MKEPDKIYVSIGYEAQTKPFHHSIEYIRKDALLEWAKSKKARLKQGYKHDWKNDDMLHGGTLILDNLIDKIESL